ncbi:MAG: GNAT family N-acetyltransferase [Vicinamibacterales bacterium]
MTNHIDYRVGNDVPVGVVKALYEASTLGQRRPINDPGTLEAMMHHANLVVSAWDGSELVGISRTLTDFVYVGYLSDLAVHARCQRQGIGIGLIENTRAAMGPKSKLILLAAPAAVDYYPRIGFTHHPQAWILAATDPFPTETAR